MRAAVLILSLLGAAASSTLAASWLDHYGAQRAEMEPFVPLVDRSERLTDRFELIESRVRAAHALIASALLCAAGIALVAARRDRLAALPLVVAGLVPGFFTPHALIFCGLAFVAGVLALALPRERGRERSFRRTDLLSPHP